MTAKNMSVCQVIGNATYSRINQRIRYVVVATTAGWVYHQNRILLEDSVISSVAEAISAAMINQTRDTNV
jgi:hypothetical protein